MRFFVIKDFLLTYFMVYQIVAYIFYKLIKFLLHIIKIKALFLFI